MSIAVDVLLKPETSGAKIEEFLEDNQEFGWTASEIAKKTNCNTKTVKTRSYKLVRDNRNIHKKFRRGITYFYFKKAK